jgi:hypothetical protein
MSWLIGALLLLGACTKFSGNLNELPTSNSDWLLPLVKGKIGFDNLKRINSSVVGFDLPSTDLGYASGISVNVPPITVPELGPYIQPLSDWIHSVEFDTLQLKLTFNNVFPIAVGAGTRFSFRNSAGTGNPSNVIYEHVVPADIAPGQPYSFEVKVVNNSIGESLYMYLEQFTSPGGNSVTFSSAPSKMQLEVGIIDIKKVELNVGKSTVELDTVDVDFGDEELNTGQVDTSSYGTLNFFFDHALPIHMNAQIYFLDPLNGQILDSLLTPPFALNGCQTNAAGDPLNVNSSKNSLFISTARINKIRKSNKAVVSFKMNTNGYPGPYVQMSDKTYLKLQITGDLHLSINLNDL